MFKNGLTFSHDDLMRGVRPRPPARGVAAAYKRAVGAEDPPPKSIFGRRRLARAEAITLDLSSRPASGMPTSPLGIAAGPLPKTRWHGDTVFLGELRPFWGG